MAQPLDLQSPLPPGECAARLKALLGQEANSAEVARLCLGSVSEAGFSLGRVSSGRSVGKLFLRAVMSAEGVGTRIRGSIGLHPLVRASVVALAVVVAVRSVWLLLQAPWFGATSRLGEVMFLLAVSAIWGAVGTVCWYADREDARWLRDLVVRRLEVEDGGARQNGGEARLVQA